MKRIIILCAGALLYLITVPTISSSKSVISDSTKTIGIGFQCAPFPIFGLGVIYNLSETIGLQGIGRMGIDIDFLAVRGLYRFRREPKYSVYVGGLIGYFRDPDVSKTFLGPEESDEEIGFGFGGGFEYFFKGLPDVGWNVEVDFIHIAFEKEWWQYDYKAFSLIMLGIGVHYYF